MAKALLLSLEKNVARVQYLSDHPSEASTRELDSLRREMDNTRASVKSTIGNAVAKQKEMKRLYLEKRYDENETWDFSEERTTTLQGGETYYEAVEHEMLVIQEKLEHVKLLYTKLAEMVALQGEFVNRIDRNLGGTQNSIDVAMEQLQRYEWRQLNCRPRLCCMCTDNVFFRFLIAIVILVAIASIVLVLLPRAEKGQQQ